jgi:rare lipoprotein A
MRQILSAFTFLAIAVLLSSFRPLFAQDEFGKAGYYADALHGRRTASGEIYDKNELTCAHKTLPFGTPVRVTRLDNQKSVVVRVNDRGPFVEGYVVDISRRAAEEIGLVREGVTRVKLEVLESNDPPKEASKTDGSTKLLLAQDEPKLTAKEPTTNAKSVKTVAANNSDPEPATSSKTSSVKTTTELFKIDLQGAEKVGFGVQVSTLYDADNVLPVLRKLQKEWPNKSLVLVEKNETDKITTYKVIVGPFTDKKTTEGQQKLAIKKGYKGCFLVDLGAL